MTQNYPPHIKQEAGRFGELLDAFVKAANPQELSDAVTRAAKFLESDADRHGQSEFDHVNNATYTVCQAARELFRRLSEVQAVADLLMLEVDGPGPEPAPAPAPAPSRPSRRKPRQSDDVRLTFSGRVVFVHENGQHIVLKDADGVQMPFTWFSKGLTPEIEFVKKEAAQS